MTKKLNKTVHFRRALEMTGTGRTLLESIELCQSQYPATAYPTYNFRTDIDATVVMHRQDREKCFLHIVTFEQDAGTPVIGTVKKLGVDEQPAPLQKQYILSQLYLLCSNNDVLFLSHNRWLRDTAVLMLLNKLIKNFSGSAPDAEYNLVPLVDEKRVNQFMQQGIESIDLNVGGSIPTLQFIADMGRRRTSAAGAVNSFLRDDSPPEKIDAAKKIMSRLTLKPGRNWDDLHVKEIMTGLAKHIHNAEDDDRPDDGFTIMTKSGVKITQDDIRIKHNFQVDGNNCIISTLQVQESLVSSYNHLAEIGVLDN